MTRKQIVLSIETHLECGHVGETIELSAPYVVSARAQLRDGKRLTDWCKTCDIGKRVLRVLAVGHVISGL